MPCQRVSFDPNSIELAHLEDYLPHPHLQLSAAFLCSFSSIYILRISEGRGSQCEKSNLIFTSPEGRVIFTETCQFLSILSFYSDSEPGTRVRKLRKNIKNYKEKYKATNSIHSFYTFHLNTFFSDLIRIKAKLK